LFEFGGEFAATIDLHGQNGERHALLQAIEKLRSRCGSMCELETHLNSKPHRGGGPMGAADIGATHAL
jgi:hypothetical protein